MESPITREQYESALHTIRMYTLQCNHLVATIDNIIGVKINPVDKMIMESKVVSEPKATSICIGDLGFSTRTLNAILHYNQYSFDEHESTVFELSNISKKEMLKHRGVGASTIREIRAIASEHGVKINP